VSFALDGRLYVTGGVENESISMENYNAGTNTWTELSDTGPEYRRSFGVVTVRREVWERSRTSSTRSSTKPLTGSCEDGTEAGSSSFGEMFVVPKSPDPPWSWTPHCQLHGR
jgi:hypothetical protein